MYSTPCVSVSLSSYAISNVPYIYCYKEKHFIYVEILVPLFRWKARNVYWISYEGQLHLMDVSRLSTHDTLEVLNVMYIIFVHLFYCFNL